MPQKDNQFLKIHLPLIFVQLCFSVLPAFSKVAFKTFPAEVVLFSRVGGAAFIFGIIFFLFKYQKIEKKIHYLYFAIFAFFGIAANQYLFLKGMEKTTAVNASILIASIPVFTLIVAILAKKETARLSKVIGIFISLFGVSLLLNIDKFELNDYLIGNLFVILNSLSYSIFLVYSKPFLLIYKPYTMVTYIFLFAFLLILPVTFFDVSSINYSSLSFSHYQPLVMLIIVGTIFPYLINNVVLKRTNSTVVAIYTYIQPLVGALLAIIILGELFTIKIFASGLLILFGVSITSFPNFYNAVVQKTTSFFKR